MVDTPNFPSAGAPPPADPDRVLSFKEGIAIAGVGSRKGWQMVHDGVLPHIRIGTRIKFRRSSLLAWLAAQEKGGTR